MNSLCLYLHSVHCILNEHLLQGAMRFPMFSLERAHEHGWGGIPGGAVSGKSALFTAGTAVGFACWLTGTGFYMS